MPEIPNITTLKRALASRGTNFSVTIADAALASGLPLRDAESGLHALCSTYRGHLHVTEKGEIIFRFPTGFSQPWVVPNAFAKAMGAVGSAAKTLLRFFVRAWVSIVLVGYALIFLALFVAITLSGRSSSDERSSSRSSFGFELILRIVMDQLFWMFHPWSPVAVRSAANDGWGSPRSRWRGGGGLAREEEADHPFYESVDRFFFGPPSEPEDPTRHRRAILAEIRAGKGRIGLADVMRVTGLPRKEADPLMSGLMFDYQGSVEVSEDGGISYRFPELRKTVETTSERALPVWNQPLEAPPLMGNRPHTNAIIAGINGFNLIGSLYAISQGLTLERVSAILRQVRPENWPAPSLPYALGVVPLVFSILLFALPLGRYALSSFRESKVRREKGRRAVLQEVLSSIGQGAPALRLRDRYVLASGLEPKSGELERYLLDLGGDVDLERAEEGVRYRFQDLELEQAAVEAEREAADEEEAKPGRVIFATDKD